MTGVVVAERTHEMVVVIVVMVIVVVVVPSTTRKHSDRRQGDSSACCNSDGAGLGHGAMVNLHSMTTPTQTVSRHDSCGRTRETVLHRAQ